MKRKTSGTTIPIDKKKQRDCKFCSIYRGSLITLDAGDRWSTIGCFFPTFYGSWLIIFFFGECSKTHDVACFRDGLRSRFSITTTMIQQRWRESLVYKGEPFSLNFIKDYTPQELQAYTSIFVADLCHSSMIWKCALSIAGLWKIFGERFYGREPKCS